MIRLLAIIIFFPTIFTFQNNKQLSDKDKAGFLGSVKQVVFFEEQFSNETGKWEKADEKNIIVANYDIDGHRVSETIPESIKRLGPGVLVFRESMVGSIFDFEHKGGTVIYENRNKEGLITGKRVFTYDNNGFCIEFILYDSNGIKKEYKYEYEYDDNYNWITEIAHITVNDTTSHPQTIRYIRKIEYYSVLSHMKLRGSSKR